MNRRDFTANIALGAVSMPAASMASVALAAAQQSMGAPGERSFDFVVYGGTAAGVTTAVAAARQGLRVALLEPFRHIGGMVTGGLSGTDVGKREAIGGMALEFYMRCGRRYDVQEHLQQIAWMPEPRVAESVFYEMLSAAKVPVFLEHRLREGNGVDLASGRIRAITMENGVRFTAPLFADCTYEGDLMAQAKVSYTFGREGIADYGESLAGVRAHTQHHQFLVPIKLMTPMESFIPRSARSPWVLQVRATRKRRPTIFG